jgi:hypothetical protein
MDTHAEELHKTPGHGWKHYFFEFFMLFLAVFFGFFAENIRENNVTHEKEKHYIECILSDLKKDTADVALSIINQQWLLKKMDNVLSLLLKGLIMLLSRKQCIGGQKIAPTAGIYTLIK